jgi:SAM-dependent methyltransferase
MTSTALQSLAVGTRLAASRSWLRQRVAATALADCILARRARDILGRTRLYDYLPADADCLDIGAGTAHVMEAVLAASPVGHVTAVDAVWSPAPAVARRLDRSSAGRWRFLAADGAALPFADRRFDAGWAAFVLHHLQYGTQLRVLAEIARVIRPGGIFLLLEDTPETPEDSARSERADRRLNLERRGERHFYRLPRGWHACLAISGFSVVHEVPFAGIFPRATLRSVPHRLFICRRAAPESHQAT